MKQYWNSLSDNTRNHIISAVRTFIATFVGTSATLIVTTGVEHITTSLIVSAFTAGINAGLKSLIETYAPPSLGGIKK